MAIQIISTQKTSDPNEINQAEVFEQPETTAQNILEYFDTYVKKYYAFKDEPAFKAMLSFLTKYYVDIIYNQQPIKFKELFEQQLINRDIIDLLLISIGLPENLVRELTTATKFIIMKSFADFERYKGTVKFFQSMGGALTDHMSYYELFIDYNEDYINPVGKYLITVDIDNIKNGSYFLISSTTQNYYVWFSLVGEEFEIEPHLSRKTEDLVEIKIEYNSISTSADITKSIIQALNLTKEFYLNINSTDILEIQLAQHGAPLNPPSSGTTGLTIKTIVEGKNNGAWILRPRPIYIHPKMKKVEEEFSYQEAYNKIPTLLVPEEQLEDLRLRDEIILPTKSNIILLDYTNTIDGSLLNSLFFTILMEYIGDDYFSVFLTGSNGTTTITYNTAIFLWYYLMAKYYNVPLEGVNLAYHIVMGTKKVTNFVLSDIPRIEAEYESIKTRDEINNFYLNYFMEPFGKPYSAEKPTISKMSDTLRKLDANIWEYVEQRLSTAENLEQDIQFLLDELYASIVLSFEKYKDKPIVYKYIPLILTFLTQITTNIKNTDSYKITYNLKPFHTEILELASSKIEIEDKFNAILFGDACPIFYQLILAGVLHMSDQTFFTFTPRSSKDDTLSLSSFPICNFRQINFEQVALLQIYNLFQFYLLLVSSLELESDFNFNFQKDFIESYKIISNFIPNYKLFNKTDFPYSDEANLFYRLLESGILHISDQTVFTVVPLAKGDNLELVSSPILNSLYRVQNSLNLRYQINPNFDLSVISLMGFQDSLKSQFQFQTEDSCNLISAPLKDFIYGLIYRYKILDRKEVIYNLFSNSILNPSDWVKCLFTPKDQTALDLNTIFINNCYQRFDLNLKVNHLYNLIYRFILAENLGIKDYTKVLFSPHQKTSIDFNSIFKILQFDYQYQDVLAFHDTVEVFLSGEDK